MYTVGPEYAHAEARKSPSLDGKVERDSQGKEIRYPVILNQYEKILANKVCNLFKVRVSTCILKYRDYIKFLLRSLSDQKLNKKKQGPLNYFDFHLDFVIIFCGWKTKVRLL